MSEGRLTAHGSSKVYDMEKLARQFRLARNGNAVMLVTRITGQEPMHIVIQMCCWEPYLVYTTET
ncbi:hypothetical protein CLAFUW4_07397 [Fulvia fulva]|uniref:Uncharacterized protein n=1 Tax=Passalora fulva TaxID=5499 RepID=A0A9Q8PAV5_PASFU|nr:uncharacterized protein CLAFUR5_07527 [Fulvia fulva]KAK4621632.1 hypothetical protein CLAFUR4_07404 [Fulvia fulva]KAK4622438.1 hypothetical protein CLAFUR0_07403 [Fulvia fulva]UJO19036.1 hypothetical protein CLAFUR5_07527 [Fulvia fulva]WPV16066.1 hypothetical protein CLAFUW4_07397 [Fulvia fulva]WPV30713.1 hypothetical protein CLAFUW7_07400 [Fulvia fulva]